MSENVTIKDSHEFRTKLPSPMYKRDSNIWSVLKNCIGKELTKITMPIHFNEPLSFLQRISEYLEYSYLLNKASNCDNALERTQYIVAFAVSSLSSNAGRLGKPFNPLLGETFELERNDYQFLCEQVSHHPPISAFHANSIKYQWSFFGSIYPKLKFSGKSVEIQPKGTITIYLSKWKEVYTWKNVICCVHNIIIGKLWMEQCGNMEIINHSNHLSCILNFKDANTNLADLNCIDGFILDKSQKKLCYVYGKWTEELNVVDYETYIKHDVNRDNDQKIIKNKVLAKLNNLKLSTANSTSNIFLQRIQTIDNEALNENMDSAVKFNYDNSKLLWKTEPRFSYSDQYYNFSKFAITLNEIEPDKFQLCKTDSRLRPDIRKLEDGFIEEAATYKQRLEEKQREIYKFRKQNKIEWKPRWFSYSKNPYTKENDWIYTGNYWNRNFENIEDFFINDSI